MIDKHSGEPLSGFSLYAQRVVDVLTTPLGSRVKRRHYGSNIPELLGRGTNQGNGIRLQVWVVQAFNNPINGLEDGELLDVSVYLSDVGYKVRLTLRYNGEIDKVVI